MPFTHRTAPSALRSAFACNTSNRAFALGKTFTRGFTYRPSPLAIPLAIPLALLLAPPLALCPTKPSSQTIDVADLKDFGVRCDEQLTLCSVNSDDPLVVALSEDYKKMVSDVTVAPNGTIGLALKDRVLPLAGMQKPNDNATHYLQSS